MAVTEFLDAVDKKKKEEEAAMAAAPVSEEVAPAAPSVFGTPAPMESVVDTVGQVAVQSPFSQTAAAAPNPVAAAVDPMAQPDVLAAAPAVQAPAQVGLPPEERARIETRLAGTNADIVASGETIPSLGVAAPDTVVPRGGVRTRGTGGVQSPTATARVGGIAESESEFGLLDVFRDVINPSEEQKAANLANSSRTGGVQVLPEQPTPEVAPAVEMATPESVANLSVNGTDVTTPEAITEAGQTAPEAVAPQTPTAGSGGMITRDSTGESFIGGSQVAATPEEVATYNATSRERMAAANTDAAAAERMRYNAPTIAEATGAGQTPAPRAPVRQSTKERDRSEKQRAQTLRKEGQRSIEDQMREFNREPHSMKERAAEKARLQGELNASIKEDRDYNRATAEANFANETAAYNRNTLTAAQRATGDGVSIRDQIALREEARGIEATQLEETQSYNNASAAARSLVRDVGNIEGVAGTAKAQADSAFTTGLGGMVMSLKPGSKASDLRASLDTLTADSAFSALSEMRASSKTGGALGAISERELTLLGAAKRSLSANQSDEQLIKNIDTYVGIRNRMMADAKLRFAQDYGVERANEAFGGGQGGASSAIPNDRNVSGDASTEAFIAKYNV